MSAICLIDTSIFLEILNVPTKAAHHKQTLNELEIKIQNKETLFLPMGTILETGNHISQNGNGSQRRTCANNFVSQVQKALKGESPFRPIRFLNEDQLLQWLDEFPESAMRGTGLGDLSIIHDFQRLCQQNQRRRVYIWSLDEHLSSLNQEAEI
ncbi:MAG: hypothetical protein M0Q43_03350 [Methanothrix sp.]|jgi:hypothetical protein|nr:hypothetical protein [Methanothrix sp.]